MIEPQEKPTDAGIYVAYVNGPIPNLAERIMLFWDGTRWSYPMSGMFYREHVYQVIGPLPILKLEDES